MDPTNWKDALLASVDNDLFHRKLDGTIFSNPLRHYQYRIIATLFLTCDFTSIIFVMGITKYFESFQFFSFWALHISTIYFLCVLMWRPRHQIFYKYARRCNILALSVSTMIFFWFYTTCIW
jgi:hypothetical protein